MASGELLLPVPDLVADGVEHRRTSASPRGRFRRESWERGGGHVRPGGQGRFRAIYESGRTEDGQHFFAMEIVRGKPLDVYLGTRPSPPDEEELGFRLA